MARHTPNEVKPLDLDDATPYVARLVSAEYQAASEPHLDWPNQIKFVWRVGSADSDADDQELWTWAAIKLGQTKGGKVAKLRTILNALAGRKSNDPIAWLEDGSDGESIAWGYPDGVEFTTGGDLQTLSLRIVGHNEDTNDGGSKFVVDQYAANQTSRRGGVKVGAVDPVEPAVLPQRSAAPAPEAVPF